MYDAIVIGARCGGATTAMLLARQGHRVLLVDRATFPSDIPHGHLIHRGGHDDGMARSPPRRLHRLPSAREDPTQMAADVRPC